MARSVNVISSSYGNDSVALIQWAHEQALPDVTVAYCDTGWSAPGWPVRVLRGEELARSYGFQTARCESVGMPALVRQRKGWPGNGMQFCTSELKIFPFINWIDEADPLAISTVLIGKRRAESDKRKDTPEFIDSSEIHGNRRVWHPLYAHDDDA